MPHIQIRVTVEDHDTWRAVFDELVTVRRKFGCLGGRVFRDIDTPNLITLLLGFGDAEQMRQWAASPELRAGMQRAGVVGRPEMVFLNEAEPAVA